MLSDTVEYATRHLYFPYTHEPLGECVYMYGENTSDIVLGVFSVVTIFLTHCD